jgi:hypothetical protein
VSSDAVVIQGILAFGTDSSDPGTGAFRTAVERGFEVFWSSRCRGLDKLDQRVSGGLDKFDQRVSAGLDRLDQRASAGLDKLDQLGIDHRSHAVVSTLARWRSLLDHRRD